MIIKLFKNNNVNIKFEAEEIEQISSAYSTLSEAFYIMGSNLDMVDITAFGEDGCAGNYDMYTTYYSYNNGSKYIILHGMDILQKLCKGKTLKLQALEMDEGDLEAPEEV